MTFHRNCRGFPGTPRPARRATLSHVRERAARKFFQKNACILSTDVVYCQWKHNQAAGRTGFADPNGLASSVDPLNNSDLLYLYDKSHRASLIIPVRPIFYQGRIAGKNRVFVVCLCIRGGVECRNSTPLLCFRQTGKAGRRPCPSFHAPGCRTRSLSTRKELL